VVTICLGQNDGKQDSTIFCDNYISFIMQLRDYYPKATIICLSSPMADSSLAAFMKEHSHLLLTNCIKREIKNYLPVFFQNNFTTGAMAILTWLSIK